MAAVVEGSEVGAVVEGGTKPHGLVDIDKDGNRGAGIVLGSTMGR